MRLPPPFRCRISRAALALVAGCGSGRGGDTAARPAPAPLAAPAHQEAARATMPPRHRVVVLDPGHGGRDDGAIGPDGTREADLTLAIARRTARALADDPRFDVYLTRDADTWVSLRDRAAFAAEHHADAFVSLHCNAARPDERAWARGIETYSVDAASSEAARRVAARENAMLAEEGEAPTPLLTDLIVAGRNRLSRELAGTLHREVVGDLRAEYGEDAVRDHGTRTALFYVLVETPAPAVLLEVGFITHPVEVRRLRAPHYQRAMATAIAEGVRRWFARQVDP